MYRVTLVSTTSFRCAAAESEVCVLAAGSLGSFFHHAFDPLTPFVPPFPLLTTVPFVGEFVRSLFCIPHMSEAIKVLCVFFFFF